MPNFSVDTHLFRELGALLVGRDSTALVELIKNAYDADASLVIVHGEHLDSVQNGQITITDDGNGMTSAQFERGFLRIASRIKEGDNKRSPVFKRKYTGAKGIGRLAAHKLAKNLLIESISNPTRSTDPITSIWASIDWDEIEAQETLEQVGKTDAIKVQDSSASKSKKHGMRWTPSLRPRDAIFKLVFREVAHLFRCVRLLAS